MITCSRTSYDIDSVVFTSYYVVNAASLSVYPGVRVDCDNTLSNIRVEKKSLTKLKCQYIAAPVDQHYSYDSIYERLL